MSKFEEKMLNLSRKLEVPSNIVRDVSKVEVVSNDTVFIENHNGVLLLSDSEIHINCGAMIVKISGENLDIASISSGDVSIFGLILKIDFVR